MIPGRRDRAAAAGVGLLVLVVVLAVGGLVALRHRPSGGLGLEAAGGGAAADYRYEIPAGAGAAMIRGEQLDVLPGSLDVTVGQVIEIVNDDDRGHLVGPFFVGANETVRYRFATPGTFAGRCSVHPSGAIVIRVT